MRTVHVGGIRGLKGQPGINPGEEITEDDLAAFFGNDGEVVGVRINGTNCWIEFADVQGAEAALGRDGTESGGHNLRVTHSKTPIRSNGYAAGVPSSRPRSPPNNSPPARPPPRARPWAHPWLPPRSSTTRARPEPRHADVPPPRSSTPSTRPMGHRRGENREPRHPGPSCAHFGVRRRDGHGSRDDGRGLGACPRSRRRAVAAFSPAPRARRGEPGERPADARPRRKIHGAGVRGVRHCGGGGGGVGEGWPAIGERFVEVSASSRGGVEERHAAVDVNREEKREPTRIRDRARRTYTRQEDGIRHVAEAPRRRSRVEEGRTSRRSGDAGRRLPSSSRNPRRRSRQKSVASFWFARRLA